MSKTGQIPLTPQNYMDLIDAYREDLCGFAIDIFKSKKLDDWQREFFEEFYKGDVNEYFAFSSGHSTGKSFVQSIVSLHFLLVHSDVGIVATANTKSQLVNKLGREIQVQIGRSYIKGWFTPLSMKIYRNNFDGKPDVTNFIELFTNNPDRADAASGLHAEAMLLMADEFSGLAPEIHQAFLSSTPKQTENSIRRLLYTGNPLKSSGVMFQVFKDPDISKFWHLKYLNSEECIYSDKEYINMLASSYGKDSDIYRVRVLGQFPRTGANNIIGDHYIDKALNTSISDRSLREETCVMAVDPARHGQDRAVIGHRVGNKIYKPKVILDCTITELAQEVIEYYLNLLPVRPEYIVIDGVGLGAGLVDILKDKRLFNFDGNNAEIIDFIGSRKAANPEIYANLRAEQYFRTKDVFELEEVDIPLGFTELAEELRDMQYSYNLQLKIIIESKDMIKRRTGKSPDLADWCNMLFFNPQNYKRLRRSAATAVPIVKSKYAW